MTIHEGKKKTIYCTPKKVKKVTITEHSFVEASSEVQKREDYLGLISSILCTAFNFSRKTEQKPSIEVNIKEGSKCAEHIIKLAEAKNRSKEWANGRGDIQGTPAYFEH